MTTLELHPLCTLFPRMAGAELSAMTRFNGIRDDGLCRVLFWEDSHLRGFWNYKIFDVKTGFQSESIKPISGVGIGLVLDEIGGREKWDLTPQEENQISDESAGRIYFIRSGKYGPVKIGWTDSGVESRLAALQCGNPEELTICKVIENKSITDERELHRKFSAFRIRGEWFSAEVLDSKDI